MNYCLQSLFLRLNMIIKSQLQTNMRRLVYGTLFAFAMAVSATAFAEVKNEVAPVQEEEVMEEGMYYFRYDGKTHTRIVKGVVPENVRATIDSALNRCGDRSGDIVVCSGSYKEKYLKPKASRKTAVADELVIDFRDPKMCRMMEEHPDSLRILIEAECTKNYGK